jgi:hypothetical protein
VGPCFVYVLLFGRGGVRVLYDVWGVVVFATQNMTKRSEREIEKNEQDYEELILLLGKDVTSHYIPLYDAVKDKPHVASELNLFVREVFLRKLNHAQKRIDKLVESNSFKEEEVILLMQRLKGLELQKDEELKECRMKEVRLEMERDEYTSQIGDTLLKISELEGALSKSKDMVEGKDFRIRVLEKELQDYRKPVVVTSDPRSKFIVKKKKTMEEETLESTVSVLRRDNETLRAKIRLLEGK